MTVGNIKDILGLNGPLRDGHRPEEDPEVVPPEGDLRYGADEEAVKAKTVAPCGGIPLRVGGLAQPVATLGGGMPRFVDRARPSAGAMERG